MTPPRGKHPTICGVCRQTAMSIGYVPPKNQRAQVMWLCGDKKCTEIAEKVYHMKPAIISQCEERADSEAINVAGQFLAEDLGNTDLAMLDDERLMIFTKRFREAWSAALVKELSALAPY